MTNFKGQKQSLTTLGIPWVPLSCSRYENRTSGIYILGEDVDGAAIECKVSYTPGNPELAAMPITYTDEDITWGDAVTREIITATEIPDGETETDAVSLTTLSVDMFSANLDALAQTANPGEASGYYYEIRESASTLRIIAAGDFYILETVE